MLHLLSRYIPKIPYEEQFIDRKTTRNKRKKNKDY